MLIDYVARHSQVAVDPATIGIDQDIITDGLVDSLMLLQLTNFIEDQFGVEVRPEEIIHDNFSTIARMAALIDARLGTNSAPAA